LAFFEAVEPPRGVFAASPFPACLLSNPPGRKNSPVIPFSSPPRPLLTDFLFRDGRDSLVDSGTLRLMGYFSLLSSRPRVSEAL